MQRNWVQVLQLLWLSSDFSNHVLRMKIEQLKVYLNVCFQPVAFSFPSLCHRWAFPPGPDPATVVDCCGLLLSVSQTCGEQGRRVLQRSGPASVFGRPLATQDSGGGVFSLFPFPMASGQFSAWILGRCVQEVFLFWLVHVAGDLRQHWHSILGSGLFPAPLPRDRGVFSYPFRKQCVCSAGNSINCPSPKLKPFKRKVQAEELGFVASTVVADSLLYAPPTEGVFSSLLPCFQYFLGVGIE